MEKDYQTMMTVGQGVSASMNSQPDTEGYAAELPRPEGKGWQLKQIIPVHNNNRFLQYFWERVSPVGSDEDDVYEDGIQIQQSSVRLHVRK